jgi:hypothetical protein
LQLSDNDLASRLATAFAAHPSVQSVERVEVLPRHVRVGLQFRTPVLAVSCAETLRAVDASGVLLPASTATNGLPVLSGATLPPPITGSGKPWPDPNVAAAAKLVALIGQANGGLKIDRISIGDGVLTLQVGARTIRWGAVPGKETGGEPDVVTKLTRLRDALTHLDTANDSVDLTKPDTPKRP